MNLTETLTALAVARRSLNESVEQMKVFRAAMDAASQPIVERIKAGQSAVEQLESDARALAEAEYAKNGNKHPAPGVEIKFYTKLEYKKDQALEWAKEHGVGIIPVSLDVKTFEKVAKTVKPDFVQISEWPQVTIARDLDKALTEAAQSAEVL